MAEPCDHRWSHIEIVDGTRGPGCHDGVKWCLECGARQRVILCARRSESEQAKPHDGEDDGPY